MAKRGLGRGLGDILDEIGSNYESQFNEAVEQETKGDMVAEVDINLIDPNPYQPRKHFDEEKLKELSESIKYHGLLQPIVVIEHEERYLLVAGERRLRASKLANLQTIKAIIASVELDELRLRELALIENIQRENLNPIELAHSYKELLDVHNITHDELASIVHVSRSQITNTLRLLHLESYLQNALIEGKLTQGHAKILVGLEPKEQRILTDTIIGEKLSVRESEKLVQRFKKSDEKPAVKEKKTTFSISHHAAQRIKKHLSFALKVKKQSVEIMLPTNDKLEEFLTLIESIKKN